MEMGSLLEGLVGAVLGFAAVVLAEAAIVAAVYEASGRRTMFAGFWMVAGPVMAAIGGYRYGRENRHRHLGRRIALGLSGLGREGRIWLVSLGVWLCLYAGYWMVRDHRYYGTGEIVVKFLWWLVLPPVFVFLSLKAYRWAARGTP
jgi:hypothetical protein